MIDPYAMLGVERDADDNAVKTAYRKAAKGMHPDSGGDADQFARLQACYDLLRDRRAAKGCADDKRSQCNSSSGQHSVSSDVFVIAGLLF